MWSCSGPGMCIDWRALTQVSVPIGLCRQSSTLLLHRIQHIDVKQGKYQRKTIVLKWILYLQIISKLGTTTEL